MSKGISIEQVLEFLSTKGNKYYGLPHLVCQRFDDIFGIQLAISLPALGLPDQSLLFFADQKKVARTSECSLASSQKVGEITDVIDVAFDELDELSLFSPSMTVHVGSFSSGALSAENIKSLCKDFVLRSVQRERARIRRDFILMKSEYRDVGSFLYQVLAVLFQEEMGCEAGSIFISDPITDQLRLRRTTGLKVPRPLRDVAFDDDSKSWVRQALRSGRPRFEFSTGAALHEGETSEKTMSGIRARLYWPLQIQFKRRETTRRPVAKTQLGVLRLCNPSFSDPPNNCSQQPFTMLDAFSIEFASEAVFNLIESFADKSVEGFERDLAFHSAASVADGCVKNIEYVKRALFHVEPQDHSGAWHSGMPPQFKIVKLDKFEPEDLERALNNAFSFAQDLLAQIERANVTPEETTYQSNAVTKRLFSEVLQKAVNLIPYMMTSHSVTEKRTINKIFDQPRPPPVRGEVGALTNVFKNIFENSVKYHRRGHGVEIQIDVEIPEDEDFVMVKVSDSGIGVGEAEYEKIFYPGNRTSRARDHRVRGSGLGLAYCRKTLSSFGGQIWVERPSEGVGMTVVVKLLKA